ncbi:hypothetical protein DPMN_136022 [Dreissena polymorpha]|uniref:Uncharacterized protein n=1 Tax=Dreissena polymorpha TaxID=45954 RepID=A0A9D4G316_DREPO|nr:hypothetical protein DPMN_136022 [Dreissena polymorpha]
MAERRCHSRLGIRTSSIFEAFGRMSMSELAPHSLQLNIRDKYRMSRSDLARHSPQLDIRDFCRMSDVKTSSSFVPARYSGLLPNVGVRAGSKYAPSSIFECRMSIVDGQCQLHAAQSVIIRMARVTYMIYCIV